MDVWIIEHHEVALDRPLPMEWGGGHYEEQVVMHVAATREKAIAWCRQNLDQEKREDRPWWYAISREVVDASTLFEDGSGKLEFVVDWDGTVGDRQPINGYASMALDDEEEGEGQTTYHSYDDFESFAQTVGRRFPKIGEWTWEYLYPGAYSYSRGDLTMCCSPLQGEIDVQVTGTESGEQYDQWRDAVKFEQPLTVEAYVDIIRPRLERIDREHFNEE